MTHLSTFEDFSIGQVLKSGSITITEDNIIKYAEQYDPQIMHTDPERAKTETMFKGLIASGWHTASLSMRLFVDAWPEIKGGMVGRQIDKIEWPRPVYPDDQLSFSCEITDMKASRSRPGIGIVKTTNTTTNQNGEVVMVARIVMVLPTLKQA